MFLARHRTPPPLQPPFAPILRDGTNVVNVRRTIDPFIAKRLATIAQSPAFENTSRLDATAADARALVTSIPDATARAFLQHDIEHLAGQLGAILGRRHVHAKRFVQRTSGCRKIHADTVTVRLLCTYVGPGTDWLPEADLVRKHLGRTDVGLDAANRSVIRPGGRLRRCETGDVLLLKGKRYPGNANRGAAHRSPPIDDSNISRLVLKIDENACGC